MRNFRIKFSLFLLSLAFSQLTFAENKLKFISIKNIQNFNQALCQLKKKINHSFLIPNMILAPEKGQSFYANYEIMNANYFRISVDTTKDCKGAKVCSAGSVDVESYGSPTIMYDRNNEEITERVTLKNGKSAYFTPRHAMGSYFPASIEIRLNEYLYRITWQTMDFSNEKTVLIQMANSLTDKIEVECNK